MPFGVLTEPILLDQMFGATLVGQVNSTIAAGTTAQTTFNIRGSTGSGNADITPANNDILLCVTPGSGATQNQYTAPDVFLATSGTATSVTFASRTVVAARAVGDFIFKIGVISGATFKHFLVNTWYVGLSTTGAQCTVNASGTLPQTPVTVTANSLAASGTVVIASANGLQVVAYTGGGGTTSLTGCTGGTGAIVAGDVVFQYPTDALIKSNEPTSTGSYARVAVLANTTQWPAASAGPGSTKSNGGAITFPASTAAWSTGATVLDLFFLADASTLAGGNIYQWGYLTTAQAVNASGITPSFATSQLTMGLI
jgi:hypothetical protein